MAPMTLLRLEPEAELEFPKPGQHTASRKLTLTNNSSSEYVAFKVKTTAPKSYLVRPSSGVLSGKGASREVEIILQAQASGETTDKENHRFLVQAVIVSSDAQLDRNAWQEYPKEQIQEKRLNVAFSEGGAGRETTAAADPAPAKSAGFSTAISGARQTALSGDAPKEEDLRSKYDELVQYTLSLEKQKKEAEAKIETLQQTRSGAGAVDAAAGYTRRDIILAALVAFIVAYLTKYL